MSWKDKPVIIPAGLLAAIATAVGVAMQRGWIVPPTVAGVQAAASVAEAGTEGYATLTRHINRVDAKVDQTSAKVANHEPRIERLERIAEQADHRQRKLIQTTGSIHNKVDALAQHLERIEDLVQEIQDRQ